MPALFSRLYQNDLVHGYIVMAYSQDIPSAETVYPTAEEFADPLAFIESIRHLGEKFGVVCIVPPEGWQPPFSLDPVAAAAAEDPDAALRDGEQCQEDGSLRFQVRALNLNSLLIMA